MNRVEIVVNPASPFGRARINSRALLWPLMSCLALACADERQSITAAPAPPASAIALSPTELYDRDIDATDSYLITTSVTRTTTTVESAEPFLDPTTGQEVTSLAFPEVVDSARFEAGYDAGGVVRLNEQRTSSDSGGVATRVQIVGNTAAFYNEFGVQVHDSAGPILMDALGSVDDAVVTTNAVFRDTLGGTELAGSAALSLAQGGHTGGPRIERRGDRLFQTFTIDEPASGLRGQRVRQYRKSGDHWVVVDERVHTTQSDGRLSFEVVESTVYPTVKWKTNEVKDGRRRARAMANGDRAAGKPSFGRLASTASQSLFGAGAESASLPVGSIAAPSCLSCTNRDDDISTDLSGSSPLNVVFQHGAFSDAGSWSRMDPWMSSRFSIGRKVKPTLNWKEGLESQSNTLTSLMNADGGRRYLVVGHSNGGLIARRVAQKSAAAADGVVGGVVAIAAPHAGLPLASTGRSAAHRVLTLYLRNVLTSVGGSCGARQFSWLCGDINDALLTLVPNIVNYAFDATVPMTSDVRRNSAFLGMLNAQPEPFFRYSIEVESQGAWKFVRMMGDWKCNPEDRCSGDHLQNTMESVYDVLRYCGSNEISKLLSSSLAARCRSVRWSLNSVNTLYELLIAPGDASDGLVPAKSQAYPGLAAEDRERIRNAKESHVGELKGPSVYERLARLTTRFNTQAL